MVIGGWIVPLAQNNISMRAILKRIDAIYVETSTAKKGLESLGFRNVDIMPNFKKLNPVDAVTLKDMRYPPYRLCTFSRVMAEKGIEDAIEVVRWFNEKQGAVFFTLDIYGKIDPAYEVRFAEVMKTSPDYIRYRGIVNFDGSVSVLKEYHALLFPTRFTTEGVPGTIVDSYAAGVPVVASRWDSFTDMVDEGKTGIGYTMHDNDDLRRALEQLSNLDINTLADMKNFCVNKYQLFTPRVAIRPLVNGINRGTRG